MIDWLFSQWISLRLLVRAIKRFVRKSEAEREVELARLKAKAQARRAERRKR